MVRLETRTTTAEGVVIGGDVNTMGRNKRRDKQGVLKDHKQVGKKFIPPLRACHEITD
jgi:hypothetical protein